MGIGFGGVPLTPGGICQCFLPSLYIMTSWLMRVWRWLVPIARRRPSVMTALRYGSCSVSLIDSVAVTSGSAALSSALSFERTLGVERRWTVMIWEQNQSLRHEKGPLSCDVRSESTMLFLCLRSKSSEPLGANGAAVYPPRTTCYPGFHQILFYCPCPRGGIWTLSQYFLIIAANNLALPPE